MHCDAVEGGWMVCDVLVVVVIIVAVAILWEADAFVLPAKMCAEARMPKQISFSFIRALVYACMYVYSVFTVNSLTG